MSVDIVAVAPAGDKQSALSWGAILAGAAAAAAVTLALLFLGSALGLSMVSPWASQSVSPTTFAISTGIGIIVIQWLSSAMGGYVTGRLRTTWTDVDSDEIFFRDTAHGFLTWCVATIIVLLCVAMTAGSVVRTGVQAAGQVASGVASGATAAAGQAAPDLTGYYVDTLYRGAPAADNADYRAETARILANGVIAGEIPQGDRTYLAQQIATRAGVSPEEAQKRVNDMIASTQSAKAKAQETAEQARKAASRASLFTFLSLVIGAFIASAAAALGGSLRDA